LKNLEKVFIALGGNVGSVSETFDIAIQKMKEAIGKIGNQSSLYKTEPWGNKNQDDFLNKIIIVETDFSAYEVLKKTLDIENSLGRNRKKDKQFAPRTIDIDILFYGKKIINKGNLIIPHPRLHLRNFVLTPLMEVAPGLVHPVLQKTIKHLFKKNTDVSVVNKI
jgi:2-amino-4-hydroxy-6-hydroxymethyldihydropteridine diphosphokinase